MSAGEERLLVINPGSTSTKAALFTGNIKTAEKTVRHSVEDIGVFEHLQDQIFFRESVIRKFLREEGWRESSLNAVVGRGGLLHPLEGGVYSVNADMLSDLSVNKYGEHASNLGAPLAKAIADIPGVPAFIVDPVVVDELESASRLSGHPLLPRRSIFHALNQRSVARLAAAEMGKDYSECRFIVAHMGGGITVGAHKNGRVVDVNNGLDGDGPFTPERSGSLPAGQLVSLCFNSGKTEKEIRKMIKGEGGVVAYCRTNDIRELEQLAEKENTAEKTVKKEKSKKSGNGRAEQIQMESEVKDISPSVVLEAFCRQTAQAICAHGATLEGKIDAVILTGGVAYSEKVTSRLTELCGWMADIKIIPGEREMEALAEGALRVLRGEEKALEYVS